MACVRPSRGEARPVTRDQARLTTQETTEHKEFGCRGLESWHVDTEPGGYGDNTAPLR